MIKFALLFTLMTTLLSPVVLASTLPDLGHPSERVLTPAEEQAMGRAFIRALKAQASFIDDELVSDYIQNLGQRLAANSPEQSRQFKFFPINSNDINAFAGPDATIGIHKGLILAATNESQLASVMAHEIAHVTQKHLTRAFQAGEDSNLTTLATVLAGILLASADPNAGAALVFGGMATGMQQQINFTRNNEYEADRVGIQILDQSNINPRGMIEFFETLQSSSFYGSEQDIEYLRTHPLNSARIAEASSRTPLTSNNKPKNSLLFMLTRQRLRVAEHDNPSELLKDYAQPKSVDMRYGRALLLTRLNQAKLAISELEKLNSEDSHIWYQLALADAYLKAQQIDKSRLLLASLFSIYPDYLPVVHAYVKTLLFSQNYPLVIEILEKQISSEPNSISYALLAQAYSAQNQLVKAYQVRAEQYAGDGYYEYAIQQLTNALKLPDISIEVIRRLDAKIQIYKKQHQRDQLENL